VGKLKKGREGVWGDLGVVREWFVGGVVGVVGRIKDEGAVRGMGEVGGKKGIAGWVGRVQISPLHTSIMTISHSSNGTVVR